MIDPCGGVIPRRAVVAAGVAVPWSGGWKPPPL